jgi:hypothetical protein
MLSAHQRAHARRMLDHLEKTMAMATVTIEAKYPYSAEVRVFRDPNDGQHKIMLTLYDHDDCSPVLVETFVMECEQADRLANALLKAKLDE